MRSLHRQMELTDFRSFVVVAEELHFGRAAERLHLSQPPLSRRIRRIEDELGVKLFRRTTRRVEITDAGRAFLGEARSVLAAASTAAAVAKRVDRGETGRIVIGAVTPAIDGVVPAIVRDFRAQHPGIGVLIAEMDTAAQLDALRADGIHVGFVRLADHDLRGLETKLVLREPHVVALPRGHRLASARAVTLRSLAGEPLVALAPEVQPELHRRFVAACAAAGFAPRIVQTARTIPTVTALAAAGIGAAVVPASARHVRREGIAWRPLRGRLPDVEISAAWRKWNPSTALALFREAIARQRQPR
jgi:DNA-binding transcriptional LysR family regulator